MICPLRAEHGGGQAPVEEWSAGIILRQSANLMFLGGRPSPIVGPPRLFTGGRIVFQRHSSVSTFRSTPTVIGPGAVSMQA